MSKGAKEFLTDVGQIVARMLTVLAAIVVAVWGVILWVESRAQAATVPVKTEIVAVREALAVHVKADEKREEAQQQLWRENRQDMKDVKEILTKLREQSARIEARLPK